MFKHPPSVWVRPSKARPRPAAMMPQGEQAECSRSQAGRCQRRRRHRPDAEAEGNAPGSGGCTGIRIRCWIRHAIDRRPARIRRSNRHQDDRDGRPGNGARPTGFDWDQAAKDTPASGGAAASGSDPALGAELA